MTAFASVISNPACEVSEVSEPQLQLFGVNYLNYAVDLNVGLKAGGRLSFNGDASLEQQLVLDSRDARLNDSGPYAIQLGIVNPKVVGLATIEVEWKVSKSGADPNQLRSIGPRDLNVNIV
jgi:hypothetical protein